MSKSKILESKMNSLVNFYNSKNIKPDHISITKKDNMLIKDMLGEVMGLFEVDGSYEFRGYEIRVMEEL